MSFLRRSSKKLFYFLVFFGVLAASPLKAQALRGQAPLSPTRFTEKLSFETQNSWNLLSSAVLDYGQGAGYQTLSVRGSKAQDVSVSLEGIRLNSAAQSEFDFGPLIPFGFGDSQLIRGAYAPLSTQAAGHLALRLPETDLRTASLTWGSYKRFGFGIQTPFASFALDQSDEDFSYGTNQRRERNAYQRMNARAWWRRTHSQTWTQFLYSDQELPGSTDFPLSATSLQTLSSLSAHQWKSKFGQISFWTQYQKQDYDSEFERTDSHLVYSGISLEEDFGFSEDFSLRARLEHSFDQLWSTRFDSPLRQTSALSTTARITLPSHTLFEPSARIEFLSDLESPISLHTSLGLNQSLSQDWGLSLLSNLSLVSRAPNFNELYFRIPNLAEPNPNLKRQTSLDADLGWRLKRSWMSFEQVVFANRTYDLLQSTFVDPYFQVRNLGAAFSIGLEHELEMRLDKSFHLRVRYDLQKTRLKVDSAPDRMRPFQPTHLVRVMALWKIIESLTFSPELRFRSQTVSPSGVKLKEQTTLNFTTEYSGLAPFIFDFRVLNALGIERMEVPGFPLGNEPRFEGNIRATF